MYEDEKDRQAVTIKLIANCWRGNYFRPYKPFGKRVFKFRDNLFLFLFLFGTFIQIIWVKIKTNNHWGGMNCHFTFSHSSLKLVNWRLSSSSNKRENITCFITLTSFMFLCDILYDFLKSNTLFPSTNFTFEITLQKDTSYHTWLGFAPNNRLSPNPTTIAHNSFKAQSLVWNTVFTT